MMKNAPTRVSILASPVRLLAIALILVVTVLMLAVGSRAAGHFFDSFLSGTRPAVLVQVPESRTIDQAPARITKAGQHWINLEDGERLETQSLAPTLRAEGIDSTNARPLSLATDDFDRDGFPDLVCGHGTPTGGYLVVYFGDRRAFAPDDPQVIKAMAESKRFPQPFRSAAVVKLDQSPDFLLTGDFNRDGTKDIITAARGEHELNLMANLGNQGFAPNQAMELPGTITAMTAGQKNLSDGFADVVVGIQGDHSSELLVYADKASVTVQTPEVFRLPSAADSITMGALDDDGANDLAVTAGAGLYILHGVEPQFIYDGVYLDARAGALEPVTLPFSVKAIAVGQFIWDRDSRTEITVEGEDGQTRILTQGKLDERPFTEAELAGNHQRAAHAGSSRTPSGEPAQRGSHRARRWEIAGSVSGSAASFLTAARVSAQRADDLLMIDQGNGLIRLLSKGDNGENSLIEVQVAGAPVAVLPMRLNVMAPPSLVILQEGQAEPTLMMLAPEAAFAVSKNADTNDGTCNADCSLREAIVAANANGTGSDMITFNAGVAPTLSITSGGLAENLAATGDLDINSSVSIVGNGAASTIISTSYTSTCGDCKLFGINQTGNFPSLAVSFSGVTVQNGFNNGVNFAGSFFETGGGVDFFLTGPGTAYSITDSIIKNNTATGSNASHGGGVNVDGCSTPACTSGTIGDPNNGTVTFTNDTFSGNVAQVEGGGLNLFADKHDVNITNSDFTGNSTQRVNGGGLQIRHSFGGTITVSGGTYSNNTATGGGGGINASGNNNVSLSGLTISGNTSSGGGPLPANSFGGGLAFTALGVAGFTPTMTANNLTISTNHADGTLGQGGGVYYGQFYNASMTNSTISGNTAKTGAGICTSGTVTGTSFTVTGGSLTNNTASINGGGLANTQGADSHTILSNFTITGNSATTAGGGLFVDLGTLTANLNRIVGNTASSGAGIARTGGTASVENNWWACDGFPNATGCQTGSGTFDADPRIDLRLTAAPTTLLLGGGSTLTADLTKNTDGVNTNSGNAPTVMAGLNWTFDAGPKGSIGAPLTLAVPANGISTKTWTANSNSAACGAATPSIGVDSGTQTASITVQCADLTVGKSNNVSNSAVVGQQWTWTLTVTNGGNANAVFGSGSTILSDNLPNGVNINYGAPVTAANANCTINGNSDVSCTANAGGVTIAPAGSITVTVTATGTAPAPQANPRSGGSVTVDPNDIVVESNEGNNTAATNTVTVNKANTSVGLTSNQDPSVFGQTVTFTATVSITAPGAGTLTGTVNFLDGGNPITGCQNVALSAAQAQCITSALAVGNHTITAAYSGDSNFNTSTGNLTGNPQVVNKADTTLGLVSNFNPSVFGQSVTFTATVSAVAPGGGTIGGTVSFLDGGNPIPGCTSVPLAAGQAQCVTASLAAGNHTITAAYGGDANFNTTTGSLTGNPQVVNKADTSVGIVSNLNPSTVGQAVTFTATIAPTAPGAGTPAGTVQFLDGGNPIAGCNSVALTLAQAQCMTSALSVGSHTISANYSGNVSFNASTGNLTGNPQIVSSLVKAFLDLDGDGTTDYAVVRDSGLPVPNGESVSTASDSVGDTEPGDPGPPRDGTLGSMHRGYYFKLPGEKFDPLMPRIERPGDIEDNQMRWLINTSGPGADLNILFGTLSDFPVPADYDGDGKCDLAVWTGGVGAQFRVLTSSSGFVTTVTYTLGNASSDPSVVGDYDGDGKADPAVMNATTGQFTYLGGPTHAVSTTVTPVGAFGGGFPIPGDYDGDGKYDFMLETRDGLNPTQAHFYQWNNNGTATPPATTNFVFGNYRDVILPGDYDGDGKTDIGLASIIVNPMAWRIRISPSGTLLGPFNLGDPNVDYTITGDYNGDQKGEITIWHPSGTVQFQSLLAPAYTTPLNFSWGQSGDYPVAYFNAH